MSLKTKRKSGWFSESSESSNYNKQNHYDISWNTSPENQCDFPSIPKKCKKWFSSKSLKSSNFVSRSRKILQECGISVQELESVCEKSSEKNSFNGSSNSPVIQTFIRRGPSSPVLKSSSVSPTLGTSTAGRKNLNKVFTNIPKRNHFLSHKDVDIGTQIEIDEDSSQKSSLFPTQSTVYIVDIGEPSSVESKDDFPSISELSPKDLTQFCKTNRECFMDTVWDSENSVFLKTSSCASELSESDKAPLTSQFQQKSEKRYKKGTLAYRFKNILNKQKADVAIWKHELYLSKSNNYKIPNMSKNCLPLLLTITSLWKEFGAEVLQCHKQSSSRSHIAITNQGTKLINSSKCFVILRFNEDISKELKVNTTFKLYPPYDKKIITFKTEYLDCYVNVSKMLPYYSSF